MYRMVIVFSVLLLVFSGTTYATVYGGVDFPDGAVSFADVVVSCTIEYDTNVPPNPAAQYTDCYQSLGPPDYDGTNVYGSPPPYAPWVSLGDGGEIVLKFTDNSLTGSDNTDEDLWIFEVGTDVEDTYVDISKNGVTWYSVGMVTGGTLGVDIDAYGWDSTDLFSYVRLTDDPDEGEQPEDDTDTLGADIDAVGAISSGDPVPEPTSMALVGLGVAGIGFITRRRKKKV